VQKHDKAAAGGGQEQRAGEAGGADLWVNIGELGRLWGGLDK
jgi:hypothetical protein